jgi:glycosyltransferase involved in cell wall biosynthesis
MRQAPVAIVCSNTSNNCLGRAMLLADLVRDRAETKVVGFQLQSDPWPPAKDSPVRVVSTPLGSALRYGEAAAWLRRELVGHRVIVSKPMFTSLGVALRAGVSGAEMLLDIDDWEVGLYNTRSGFSNAVNFANPNRLNSYWSTVHMDKVIPTCRHRMVSNTWLEERYGGTLLPHVRNTDELDPRRVDRQAERARYDMNRHFWIGFVGSLRPHKGVEDLLAAVALQDANVGLYIAGAESNHPYGERLLAQARSVLPPERLRVLPAFPLSELPQRLALADVLCMPSREFDAAQGQIPAKLFDAMSMAVPVIATKLNDMPRVLGDGGIIVPPSDPAALAQAVSRLQTDPALRESYGSRARQRAIAEYSYSAGRVALERALAPIEPWRGPPAD